MINKISIIDKHLEYLYELKNDIYMNIDLNNNLDIPVQENLDELSRCLYDTNLKIEALKQELGRALLENQ
jgi:hypothetical protein